MNFVPMIAVLGLVLFWASLLWLPLLTGRAVEGQGETRRWNTMGVVAFIAVLLGYTYTMSTAGLTAQGIMSLAWCLPLVCVYLGRRPPEAPWKHWDKWIGGLAIVTFVPANFVLLPTALLLLARMVIWG